MWPEASLLAGYVELADCKFDDSQKWYDALTAKLQPIVDEIAKAKQDPELRKQLVEKAVAMLVDGKSLAKNYDVVRDKLLSRSGDFVTTVVREGAPETGKDGLASLTTEAVVNVKAVQKSLNEMSRSERVDFIRASGDPRVAVRIVTRDADRPDASAQPSPAAENILKITATGKVAEDLIARGIDDVKAKLN